MLPVLDYLPAERPVANYGLPWSLSCLCGCGLAGVVRVASDHNEGRNPVCDRAALRRLLPANKKKATLHMLL